MQYVTDRPGHDRRYAIDFSKIEKEIGWTPRYNLEEGLRQTVRWYAEQENWWRRIKSGAYREFYEKHYGETTSVRVLVLGRKGDARAGPG